MLTKVIILLSIMSKMAGLMSADNKVKYLLNLSADGLGTQGKKVKANGDLEV